jgi:hypothetical protein
MRKRALRPTPFSKRDSVGWEASVAPAARVLHGEAVELEAHADALHRVPAGTAGDLGELRVVAAHAHDETGLVVERLLMTEEDHLVADLEGALAGADGHKLDGRR